MKTAVFLRNSWFVVGIAVLSMTCENGTEPDETPPTVEITYPDDGATLSGPVTIQVTAADDDAVEKVSFLIDGGVIGQDSEEPYEYDWDVSNWADGGVHTILAKATDKSGNVGQSDPVSVTVLEPFTGNNNSAVLAGSTVGEGTTDVSQLRKLVSLTLLTPNADFSVGTSAYAARTYSASGYTNLIIPITNVSSHPYWFVELTDLVYRDNNGQALATGNAFVEGSVGHLVASGIYTNTCLAPGETGYVLDIEPVTYASVSNIEFNIDAESYSIENPGAKLIPQSYQYTPGTYWGELTVFIKNQGSQAGIVSLFSTYILLDSNELPLNLGFLWEYGPSGGVIGVGQTGSIKQDPFIYDGTANKMRVILNFEDQSAGSASPAVFQLSAAPEDYSSQAEYEKALLDRRNQQEEYKRQHVLDLGLFLE